MQESPFQSLLGLDCERCFHFHPFSSFRDALTTMTILKVVIASWAYSLDYNSPSCECLHAQIKHRPWILRTCTCSFFLHSHFHLTISLNNLCPYGSIFDSAACFQKVSVRHYGYENAIKCCPPPPHFTPTPTQPAPYSKPLAVQWWISTHLIGIHL